MRLQRKTIVTPVAIEGVGLHSGLYTKIDLRPAAAGDGVVFIRTDLRGLRIPAHQSSTTALDYATSVGVDDVSIGTVEHLLAAVAALGITDLEILIDGPEVPIIDGSSLPFVHLIEAAGVRDLDGEIDVIRIREPIEVSFGDKSIRIDPAAKLSVHYRIDFPHPAIGKQALFTELDADSFTRRIAPARTFGFVKEVEQLRAAGLARGGSVENCLVLDDEKVVNGPLRFRDEFVRHKILDLFGDLLLLGRPIVGEITAVRAGHALHSRFVQAILKAVEKWESGDEIRSTAQVHRSYLSHK